MGNKAARPPARVAEPVNPPNSVVPINYVMDWDREIIGMERAKRSLDAALSLPLKFPAFCRGNPPVRSLLMWGPPGTGKTMIAKAFARASGKEFQIIDPGNIMSAYWGKTAEAIKQIFDSAINDSRGKVILMDELDAFGQDREGSGGGSFMRQIFTQLLQSIQELINAPPTCKSLFIGCTNTVKDLDSALRRRFSQLIYCDLPTADERCLLLKQGLSPVERDETLSDEALAIAAETMELYSGSDICRLVNYVREAPMLEIQRATFFRLNNDQKWDPCTADAPGAERKILKDLTDDSLGTRRRCNIKDLETVMASFRPTLTQDRYEKFLKELEEIGGGDLSSRITQVDQRNLYFEDVTPESREIDSILYTSDLTKLNCDDLAREINGASMLVAGRIQKFMLAASSSAQQQSICKECFKQVKLPVFVGLLLSGFVPHLIWLLVAIACTFVLLNVVAIPFYTWGMAVSDGKLAEVGQMAEETKEFLIFFIVAFIICWSKQVVVTDLALLDAFVLTWVMFLLQSVIAGIAGYAIFAKSAAVTKRVKFYEELVRKGLNLRQAAEEADVPIAPVRNGLRRRINPQGLPQQLASEERLVPRD